MERKKIYFEKLNSYVNEYSKVLIVGADNVGSLQLQKIRTQLRGKAVVLMGKNTMVRKGIRDHPSKKVHALLPHIKNNVGLIFTNSDMNDIRKVIDSNRVGAPAKAGAISPVTVIVPGGNTGQEPTKTSFFQALGIPTKITKGTVEIISDVTILKPGDKVGNSEAALLQMMGIKPFSYGLVLLKIYDNGDIYEPSVLDISDEHLLKHFQSGLANVTCLSLGAGIPNAASLPHMFLNAYKNVLSVALGTEYSFPEADKIKQILENPEAFAAVAAPSASTSHSEEKAAKKEEPKKEEPKEESDGDMGFSLFE